MKKFQFNLQKLLSYKEQLLDGELMNLAVLNSMLARKKQKLQRLCQERIASRTQFEKEIQSGLNAADFAVYNRYEKRISRQIQDVTRSIETIRAQVEAQIERIKDLKMETKSLESIKEIRYEEYRAEQLKKEELFIDEFVAGRSIAERR